jgi:glycosyltransferase involved in cell wall biosynthesis
MDLHSCTAMRIVLVNHEYTLTGASRVLLSIAQYLRDQGHEIGVMAMNVAPGTVRDEYLARGFRIVDGEALDIDPQTLVVCNTAFSAPAVASFAPFAKVVWWIHEGDVGAEALQQSDLGRAAFTGARAVVFQSARQRDVVYRAFTKRLPKSKCVLIPYGIDDPASDTVRPELSVGKPAFRVAFIGSIYARKFPSDLVRAIDRLADLDLDCVLIGRFYSLDGDAQEIVDRTPSRFTFTGELPHGEAMAWLASADVFSLPSSSESQPLSSLEAGIRSKALVLSDLPTYDGLWRHGRNCLLHPVGDVERLAAHLRRLALDAPLRRRLAEAAHHTAGQFTQERFHSKLDALIRRLA